MGLHAPLAGDEQREAWRASGAAVRDEPTAVRHAVAPTAATRVLPEMKPANDLNLVEIIVVSLVRRDVWDATYCMWVCTATSVSARRSLV